MPCQCKVPIRDNKKYIMGLRMEKRQAGFTLIELMIVIAVIGALAALAIAAYQEYQIRSQISESMSLMAGLKNNIAEYYNDNGFFPTNNAIAGAPNSASIVGKYVTEVSINNGVATALLGNEIHAKVFGETVALSPTFEGGSFVWHCDTVGTSVAPKYLPSVCR